MTANELAKLLIEAKRSDNKDQKVHWMRDAEDDIRMMASHCERWYQIDSTTQLKIAQENNHPIYLDCSLEQSAFDGVEMYVIFNIQSWETYMKDLYPKYTPNLKRISLQDNKDLFGCTIECINELENCWLSRISELTYEQRKEVREKMASIFAKMQ